MTRYEYKMLPAPTRGVKAKGVKSPEARFAHALELEINALAAEGWEYLRADTMPHEERQGLTGSATTFRTLLVFRRNLVSAAEPADLQTVASSPAPPLTDAPETRDIQPVFPEAPEAQTDPEHVQVRPEAVAATLRRDDDLPPQR